MNRRSVAEARRKVSLQDLPSVVDEIHFLLSDGYEQHGNWTLGQICRHLRLTIDASIDGYPAWMSWFKPVRPILRWLMLPRLLAGNSTAGIPTARIYVPGNDAEDALEADSLELSIKRFMEHDGTFHPHPGFGLSDKRQLEPFHAAHAAHHLGFLTPRSNDSDRE